MNLCVASSRTQNVSFSYTSPYFDLLPFQPLGSTKWSFRVKRPSLSPPCGAVKDVTALSL